MQSIRKSKQQKNPNSRKDPRISSSARGFCGGGTDAAGHGQGGGAGHTPGYTEAEVFAVEGVPYDSTQ